jgi:ribonuclease BN (tRNA processing enzyme)
MSNLHLTILGSSAGLASKTRAGSCYLLNLGNEGILFDIGDGATRNFLAQGFTPEWVSHVVITHTHADHAGGLGYFLQQRYLSGTDNPLTIHCPGEAVGPIRAIFNFGYMFKDKLPFTIDYKPHVERHPFLAGVVRVTPFPTSHLAAMRSFAEGKGLPNRGECFAMRIDAGEKVIVYSADLGGLDDLDIIPTPIDWLLVESTHVPLERLWPWAEERKIKRIILTHIADTLDTSRVPEGKSHTSAEIVIAEDGLTLDI